MWKRLVRTVEQGIKDPFKGLTLKKNMQIIRFWSMFLITGEGARMKVGRYRLALPRAPFPAKGRVQHSDHRGPAA